MPRETSRRVFLKTVGGGLAARSAFGAASRPNIVFILADDMGYGDLGCYNAASRIPTPHIDRLAAQGMRFTDAHSPSAVCTPTRYGVLTGRYCWRSRLKRGVLNGYSPALIEPGRLTVPSLLKRQGYRTAAFGKWHLGLGSAEKTDYTRPLVPGPNAAGFDSFYGIPASLDMEPYVWVENERVQAAPTASVEGIRERRGIFWRGGPMAPGFRHDRVLPEITERAVAYVREQRAGQPFFLYLPLTAPHTPWLAEPRFRGSSGAGEYGDFAAMVDDAVGRVLHALEARGLAGETLVIFTSDNGAHWLPGEIERWGHRANHMLRGQKADIWEGGHRVPFIARWPGQVRAGSTSAQLTCLTDLMATAAEIVGFELPPDAGEDSYSLLPALLGQSPGASARDAVVHHSGDGHFAIRQGPWKLIPVRGSGGFTPPKLYQPKPGEPPGELFNLAEDPSEQRNLYLERPEVAARLAALLDRYRREGRSR